MLTFKKIYEYQNIFYLKFLFFQLSNFKIQLINLNYIMGKKIAILQSNYIPWKGYFDIINSVDEFIIYDDVQYTKNDWRNRNIIQTARGPQWITIPVKQENLNQKIFEIVRNTL